MDQFFEQPDEKTAAISLSSQASCATRVGKTKGFQIGGQETDIVLLVMNQSGADRLLSNTKFTLGAEATVAAGPVGRGTPRHGSIRSDLHSFGPGVELEGEPSLLRLHDRRVLVRLARLHERRPDYPTAARVWQDLIALMERGLGSKPASMGIWCMCSTPPAI